MIWALWRRSATRSRWCTPGEIVESGTLKEIYTDKRHPYTIGLFDSLPDIENDASTLKVIQGMVPDPRKPSGWMQVPPQMSLCDRSLPDRKNQAGEAFGLSHGPLQPFF